MNDDIIVLHEARPNRADAVKNRALLLETAQRLFDAHGVECVSMSAVAEAAGVGKGTLYRHFTNKTELSLALLDQDQRDLQERTFQRLRVVDNPIDNLRWFLSEVASFADRNRRWLGVARQGGISPDTREHPAHLWWRQTVRSLLQRAQVAGDLDYAADVFYALLDPAMIDFQRRALGYDMERVERGLHETLDRFLP